MAGGRKDMVVPQKSMKETHLGWMSNTAHLRWSHMGGV